MLAPKMRVLAAVGVTSFLGFALASAACHRQTAPPPAARPLRIPKGCEVDLSGEYTFKGREDWRYLASDDGGTLVLLLVRTSPDGGSGAERSDGGTWIGLERTPDGFVGDTHALAWPPRGAPCAVSFPTEVTACGDGGLALRAVDAISVDEACRAAPAAGAPLRDVELVRARHSAVVTPGSDGGR